MENSHNKFFKHFIGTSMKHFLMNNTLQGNREDIWKFIQQLIIDSIPIHNEQHEPFGVSISEFLK